MSIEKMQHCFNCGDVLGVYRHYAGDEPECCGKQECQKELRWQMEAARNERRWAAEDDNYSRY